MTDTATNEPQNDGWEWAVVEIFGHRRHAGRTREEERFGAKMLRIDIPVKGDPAANGWQTHYYGGSSIFSFSLATEETVMRANKPYESASRRPATFRPDLPEDRYSSVESEWFEWCPVERLSLPGYVPDVGAGHSAPIRLSEWKIKAIKLAIILEERPVTRSDFKDLKISPTRWTDKWTGWLDTTLNGYVANKSMPDFRTQHPVNYEQIKADRAQWMPKRHPGGLL